MSLRNLLADDLIEADFRGEALSLERVLASASIEVLDELRRECEEHDDWPELEAAVEAEISARTLTAPPGKLGSLFFCSQKNPPVDRSTGVVFQLRKRPVGVVAARLEHATTEV